MRLQLKADKLREEEDKKMTGYPNTNVKSDTIRTAEEYYNDQLQALENKKTRLEEILMHSESVIRDKPEITEVFTKFINFNYIF
jgi:hypothetical protein